ncbi:Hypothetical predicted protein [Argonauta hians]
MNLDSLSLALAEISNSVATLSKKNYKTLVPQINHLTSVHCADADRYLFRCLFSHVDFSGDGKSGGKDFHQTQYLIQEFTALFSKPNFVSTLCYVIDNPLQHQKSLKASPQLFPQLSKVLKLTRVQEVVFGLALLNSSNPDTQNYAANFVKQKLPDLLRSYVDSDTNVRQEGGLQDIAIEGLHLLLTHLVRGKDQLGIGADQKEAFLNTLRKDFPRACVPIVLSPLLYPETEDISLETFSDTFTMPVSMNEASLGDMVLEAGCACTSSVEECRNTLLQFCPKELKPSAVAQVMGMMAKNPYGQMDQNSNWNSDKEKDTPGVTTWNVDIFVQIVQELAPKLEWTEVVAELDYANFSIQNKKGLKILVQGLVKALTAENFPVKHIYKPWKNSEGQLSFLTHALKNPDVFCLADYPYEPVITDVLKAAPDEDNKEILTWKSKDLVQALLRLSDLGHYPFVTDLFKFPVQNCPDMLTLALLQIDLTWNILKQELLSSLIPIFLNNHPNSAIVLNYAWHYTNLSTNIRTLIMHSMADWYMRSDCQDQIRLARILDVAQDLKALSMLLNATPFPFVIDLACLASRREYLKLDKWLSDKIREHREPFVQACVNFLKRRFPAVTSGSVKEEHQTKNRLPTETVTTMLACLQNYANQITSHELSEAILNIASNANQILNKSRQMPPGAVGAKLNQSAIAPAQPNPVIMAPITNMNALDMGAPAAVTATFPQSLATLSSAAAAAVATGAPGSPAKGFPAISQVPTGYGSIQNLSTQLQNLNLQAPISAPLMSSRNAMYSLGSNLGPQTLKQTSSLDNKMFMSQLDVFPEGTPQQFSKDVEDEANSYFQKIYNQPPHQALSIDEVLDMLKRFRESQNKREREVCQCMLRNLFEEYCFFPQYPERELHITAVLFGGIIEQGLVTYMSLGIALRYVLEALRKPHASKMYFFGIAALDKFKTRLKDYPQYCQHVAAIPHFSQFPQHLIDYVEYGATSQEPPTHSQTNQNLTAAGMAIAPAQVPVTTVPSVPKSLQPLSIPSTTSAAVSNPISSNAISKTGTIPKPSIANATNIDTLIAGQQKEEIAIPPESFQDKVFFIFNNLSMSNMVQKAEELQEHATEEYVPWIAMYMVMKRASIEPNFHVLYANFVDVLQINNFYSMVLKETFRNIKVLLRSDKGVANFSDRSLLKNLGHWLGMLTLAKNKPILQIDIDLKALLYEAYNKGAQELLYVVPFTAKVLQSCAKSKVFKPPNPWTMAGMNVLAELHQEHELKLNLKFEIEVLCKNLQLDVTELKATSYLKDVSRLSTIENQLSAPVKPPPPGTPQQDDMSAVAIPSASTPTVISTPTTTISNAIPIPQQPQFRYQDISNLASGISHQVVINDQILLFHSHQSLKQCVRPAIERAIHELLPPVVDRSIKIALTTCEQITKKDFALDPDENRMRTAAQNMICSMTAGLTLITCREPVFMALNNHLKQAFLNILRNASMSQKELVDQAVTQLAQDNTELASAIIQKSAVEKALPEMDRRLSTEFELRRHARGEGRRYCDPVVLTYQAERMPEQIRLRVGGVTPVQVAVYDEFARNIPGFLPMNETRVPTGIITKTLPPPYPDGMSQVFDKVIRDIEQNCQQLLNSVTSSHLGVQLQGVIDAILVARTNRDVPSSSALVQKVVEALVEHYSSTMADQDMMRFCECCLHVLKGLSDIRVFGPQWTMKQVTRSVFDCREEIKYNLDAFEQLLKNHFLNIQQFDMYLAQQIDNGINYIVMVFAIALVQKFVIDDKASGVVTEADLHNTIEVLLRIHSHTRPTPDGLAHLVECLRNNGDCVLLDRAPGGPTSMMQSGISQAREYDDPPWLHEKTEILLREWVTMFHSAAAGRDSTKAFTAFVQQMHVQGILKTDDLITRFFRLCTEMCVDLCYRALGEQLLNPTSIRTKCFQTLDAFVRLIALLVKHSGDAANTVTKINLLNKVLGIVAGVLLQDHEIRHTEFQQMPYHRIFIMLFIELNAPEPILEAINFQVLTAFCNTFHILRPARAPGFAFAWLELISHRVFIGRMLALTPQQRGWGMYAQLLIDLFRYLAPFLRNADLTKPTQLLYKGMLRALLVLLHDFPEFLCDYHYAFCDAIPPNCIQMRNLILSAFPRNMRMPDPFTPNLKVDVLPDIGRPPRILTNFANMIQPESFKKDLDSYLKTRSPVTFLSDLRSNLQSTEPGSKYNISLINALVLYVGTQAIDYIHNTGYKPSMRTIAHTSHMDIFQNLAVDLDTEGRYLFLTAITNQLRYPNSHTHYFSCTLLYLFVEANAEAIQEQITRVLLERLIVNRPHPWGLLITFIELIKNPQFKFWSHEFVRCAPEIEKLFESVARSCIQPKQAPNIREQDATDVH